jgi:hypothetical protein
MITVLGGLGLYALAVGGLLVWLPVATARLFWATPAQNGLGMGVAFAAGTVGGVTMSTAILRWLMPRIGPREALRIARWIMLATTPILLVFPFIGASWQAYALMGPWMLAATGIGVLAPTILQDMAPAIFRARFLAVFTIVTAFCTGAAPSLVGVISDAMGGSRSLLYALVIVALPAWLGGIALLKLAEPRFAALAGAVAGADAG